jgi:hypothetical protein
MNIKADYCFFLYFYCMRQSKLRSVVRKLSILGLYLLFLSVQVNLKYTLFDTGVSLEAIAGGNQSNTKDYKLHSPKEGKSLVLKLRLNKRYLHQDFYQVVSLPKQVIAEFSIHSKQALCPVPVIQDPDMLQSSLRGPPSI